MPNESMISDSLSS